MDRHTRHITGSLMGTALGIHDAMTPRQRRAVGITILGGTALWFVLGGALMSLRMHLGDAHRVRLTLGDGWLLGTAMLLMPWAILVGALAHRWRRGRSGPRAVVAGILLSLAALGAVQARNGAFSEAAYLYANPGKDRGLALGCGDWLAANPDLAAKGRFGPTSCQGYLPARYLDAACLRATARLEPFTDPERRLCWLRTRDFLPSATWWPEGAADRGLAAIGQRVATPAEMRAVVERLRVGAAAAR